MLEWRLCCNAGRTSCQNAPGAADGSAWLVTQIEELEEAVIAAAVAAAAAAMAAEGYKKIGGGGGGGGGGGAATGAEAAAAHSPTGSSAVGT